MSNGKVIQAFDVKPAPPAVKEPPKVLSEREVGQLEGRLGSLESRVDRESIATARLLAELSAGQTEIKELLAERNGAMALTNKIGAAVLALGGALVGGLATHSWSK